MTRMEASRGRKASPGFRPPPYLAARRGLFFSENENATPLSFPKQVGYRRPRNSPRCSDWAAVNTSRAASRFIAKIPRPTIKSGHLEALRAVRTPAVMMAMFAITSLRADRNAAGEATVSVPDFGEGPGACEIDGKRPESRDAQGNGCGYAIRAPRAPCGPKRGNSG
jgi:hypothetical protein